jgi:hypothetical protein
MPKKGDFNIVTAAAVLVIVLLISFSSYYLYKRFGVDAPLEKKVNALEGVESSKATSFNKGYEIEIKMEKVGNLQEAYNSIDRAVKDSLPQKEYALHLADKPDQSLQDFMQHMQPAIFESLAANRFIWLDEELCRRTQEAGLQYKLFVDQEHLYLQVEDGDYYVYQIIDREKSPTAQVIGTS